MYEDHLRSCSYCQKGSSSKPTIRVKVKSASSYRKASTKPTIFVKLASSYGTRKKLSELGAIIKGASYPSLEPIFLTKGASSSRNNIIRRPGPIEREVKLKELGKLVRG